MKPLVVSQLRIRRLTVQGSPGDTAVDADRLRAAIAAQLGGPADLAAPCNPLHQAIAVAVARAVASQTLSAAREPMP